MPRNLDFAPRWDPRRPPDSGPSRTLTNRSSATVLGGLPYNVKEGNLDKPRLPSPNDHHRLIYQGIPAEGQRGKGIRARTPTRAGA